MEKHKTRTSIFHIDAHGIICKTVIEGVNVLPEDVDEDQQMLEKLSGNKKTYVLVDANAFHTFTPEGLQRLKEYSARRHASAMISKSLGVRIFTDTISAALKNNPPYEVFATEKEARKWLLAIKRNREKKTKHSYNAAIAPKVHKKNNPNALKVHIDKNGILTKKILSGAHVDMKMARRSESQAHKLAGNKRILTLIDRRASYTITASAVKYIRKNTSARYRIATALLAPKKWHAPSHDIEGKKQTQPVRVFKDKASAIKWLLSLKKK